MSDLILNDIMNADVDPVHPDTELDTIVDQLANSEYSCCVIATDNNIPLGTISESTLIKIISNNTNDVTSSLKDQASQHMDAHPFTLPMNTTLVDAIKWVEKRNINTVLVTALSGELLGIVTPSELAIAYSRVIRHHTENMELTVQKRTRELEKANQKLITISMVDVIVAAIQSPYLISISLKNTMTIMVIRQEITFYNWLPITLKKLSENLIQCIAMVVKNF